MRCCVCGGETTDAFDYVLVAVTADYTDGEQWLGAHAACLNSVLAAGFTVEAHLFGKHDGEA